MRLLIVEDDDRAGTYLARGLTESGHIVDRAGDEGPQAGQRTMAASRAG